MSIEGVALGPFSTLPQTEINESTKSFQHHAVLHYFLSDDSKQDADTTTSYSKSFIELLKEIKVLTSSLSKIWENTDDYAEQYRCAS